MEEMETMSDLEAMDALATIIGALAGFAFVGMLIGLFFLVCTWRVFGKAGISGWKSLVPFYNQYLFAKIAFGNGWLFLIGLIPVVNFVFLIINFYKLGKVFGKGTGFNLGLIFFTPIFFAILAFDSSRYQPDF